MRVRACCARAVQVRALAVSADGGRLFSCASDPGVRVWDSRTLALLLVHLPQVRSYNPNPDPNWP